MNKIRVRIAPSPTGYVHIGNFRTILYNYLFARKNGADFVVRIEDTDRKRFVEGALESLLRVLNWGGIDYDEGPVLKSSGTRDDLPPNAVSSKNYPDIIEIGEHSPYIQSEKLAVYKRHAEDLVEKGHAYYCFCTPERLEEVRNNQQSEGKAPMYDRHCMNLSQEEIDQKLKDNLPFVIRLKVPKDETIEFEDVIRGKISFNTNVVDDQVLLKSDGYPTYHLAVVIDDHDMEISHVIRGEEWLPSTPKHILIYRAFGWKQPYYAHLPLLINADRSKLSKRQGDVAVEDYIKKGYLKEAIINFIALLGWNPGEGSTKEIFSIEELTREFDLSRVHKGGAVFDIKKLDWINSHWIKKISDDDLYERSLQFWQQKEFYQNAPEERKSEEYIKKVLSIERDRLSKLGEVGESNRFFFQDINYDKDLLRWKETDDQRTKESLKKSLETLNAIDDWTLENVEKKLMDAAGERRGDLLWPLRVSLSGEKKSPSPFEIAWVLGKKETIKRIDEAISKF